LPAISAAAPAMATSLQQSKKPQQTWN